MIKLDPIIAVNDVEASVKWYQQLFGCKRAHGESDFFAVLVSENNDILLCLHGWEEDDHPTMMNRTVPGGNGLILYFRTDNLTTIRHNAERIGAVIEEDLHENPNSFKKEFSLRDPDGYFLTITEYHVYGE